MAGTGFELPAEPSGNLTGSSQSGAESGALGARNDPLDTDLARIIDAWPRLPASVRRTILKLADGEE
jgi:hypothetical protein